LAKRLIRTPAAAIHMALKPSTLEKYRSTGGGPPFIRVGLRAVAYDVRDLDAWIEARKEFSTARPESASR
jgi:predicted DNA-binding transcriptional regulator AlpA